MRSALRKLGRVLLAATLTASVLVIGGVAPAHAYTCGYNDLSTSVSDAESKTTFRFEEECSDGYARITGTVYDVLCDGRAAYAKFSVYDTTGGTNHWLWTKKAVAGNGCGSNSTFTFSGSTPGQYGWRIWLTLGACSGIINCSTPHDHNFYG